jgi:hypothetical protein
MIRGYRLIDRHKGGRFRETIRGQLLSLHRRAANIQLENGRRITALRYALRAMSLHVKTHRVDNRKAVQLALRTLRPRLRVATAR